MKARNWGYWALLLAAAAGYAQFACSSRFTGCDETYTCANAAAGAAGTAGSSGEAGATDSAGTGGATLFGDCSKLGDVACQAAAQPQRLACDGAKWQAGTTCAAGELCDSRTGECAAPVPECAVATPGAGVCRTGDIPVLCGPDLVTATVGTACEGVCKNGACQLPVCGDGKLEAAEACDDSNSVAGDGCSGSCAWEPVALTGQSCARSANGAVKCWGFNGSGELGIGNTMTMGDQANEMGAKLPAVELGTNRYATQIAGVDTSVCALLDNATVKCWGSNSEGELGLGSAVASLGSMPGQLGDNWASVALGTNRTATAIVAGSGHFCALLDDGTVKCWGRNDKGQLGIGSVANIGRGANDMGDNLKPVDLGPGRKAKAIAAGWTHTCALLDDATVKCWGLNNRGELGLGDTANRGDGPGEMGQALGTVNLGVGRTARAIFAGADNTCARLDDGRITCWGDNSSGQLAQGDMEHRGDDPGEVGALPIIDPGGGRTIKQIDVSFHMCAILDDGTLKCWGSNSAGELGLGDVANRGGNAGETVDTLPVVNLGTGRTVQQVYCNITNTCAVLDNGTVKCWGFNGNGELGLGNTTNLGIASIQMGDNLPTVDLRF